MYRIFIKKIIKIKSKILFFIFDFLNRNLFKNYHLRIVLKKYSQVVTYNLELFSPHYSKSYTLHKIIIYNKVNKSNNLRIKLEILNHLGRCKCGM